MIFATGSYKAYIFLSSRALAFNIPPVQATTYYTVHDFKSSAVEIVSDAQHINDYFTIKAREDIRGRVIVEVEIKDNYVRTSNNENFYIILRFATSELGSPMLVGEQAFTFTEQRYKIEYTFMTVTQEIYIIELNPFINQLK